MTQRFYRNPNCIQEKRRTTPQLLSLGPEHEAQIQEGGKLLHTMNPEEYFIFIEEQQQHLSIAMEYYWEE